MKKKLVIFGKEDMAELADYYFTNDSDYEVVAFTVDREYLTASSFCGKPVVPFEEVVTKYPPESHTLFIAISYSKLNQIRKEKYFKAKELGYSLATFVSSHSTVLNNGNIGDNCFIFEDNTVQPFVKIGNNVTLWSGNHIGHHSTIQDHCFLASHVVVSGHVNIGESCFLGVNATLRDHITIGEKSVIGAGVLLLEDAPANSLYKETSTARAEFNSDKLKRI